MIKRGMIIKDDHCLIFRLKRSNFAVKIILPWRKRTFLFERLPLFECLRDPTPSLTRISWWFHSVCSRLFAVSGWNSFYQQKSVRTLSNASRERFLSKSLWDRKDAQDKVNNQMNDSRELPIDCRSELQLSIGSGQTRCQRLATL